MTLPVTLLLSLLVLALPRKLALVPLFLSALYVPVGEGLVLLGGHFHAYRLILLAGTVRVLCRGEASGLRMASIDRIFILWAIVSVVFGTLVQPSLGLLVNRLGIAYSAAGTYFFTRCLIRDWSDVIRAVRVLLVLSLPLGCSMLVERTGHNPLAVFGGISAVPTERDGHFRAQGAFRHPIIAGSIGASLFPFAVGLFFYRRRFRREALIGLAGSCLMIVTSAASGPLIAWLGSLCGMACWKIRRQMRVVRWSIVACIAALALVMKAPVWYLFARLGDLVGGSGWHRAYLIDVAIKHLDEWWLFGTVYTAHWGPGGQVILGNPNMMDITNQFIQEGVDGGLLKMILFVVLVAKGFKAVGRAVRRCEPFGFSHAFFVWCLGVVLFAHALSFLSITYFDQSVVFWFWLLAVLAFVETRVAARPLRAPAVVVSSPATGEWDASYAPSGGLS